MNLWDALKKQFFSKEELQEIEDQAALDLAGLARVCPDSRDENERLPSSHWDERD